MSVPYKEIAEGLISFIGLVNQARKTQGADAAADEIRRMAGLLGMTADVNNVDPDSIRAHIDKMVDRLTANDSDADAALAKKFAKEDDR